MIKAPFGQKGVFSYTVLDLDTPKRQNVYLTKYATNIQIICIPALPKNPLQKNLIHAIIILF